MSDTAFDKDKLFDLSASTVTYWIQRLIGLFVFLKQKTQKKHLIGRLCILMLVDSQREEI